MFRQETRGAQVPVKTKNIADALSIRAYGGCIDAESIDPPIRHGLRVGVVLYSTFLPPGLACCLRSLVFTATLVLRMPHLNRFVVPSDPPKIASGSFPGDMFSLHGPYRRVLVGPLCCHPPQCHQLTPASCMDPCRAGAVFSVLSPERWNKPSLLIQRGMPRHVSAIHSHPQ